MSMFNRLKAFFGKIFHKVSDMIDACTAEYLKTRLHYCGEGVVLYKGVSIKNPEKVSIGKNTHVGQSVHIGGGGKVIIGQWCQIANNVIIATANHNMNGSLYYDNVSYKDVVIGNNVWIAANCIILPGVTIGDNSVISAGAVVTKDVGPNSIAGGLPARFISSVPEANK
jgi:acetyltransferase-like isoleucine patch superfamily enzyme